MKKDIVKKTKDIAENIHAVAIKEPPKQEVANAETQTKLNRSQINQADPIKIVPLRRIKSRVKPQEKWEKIRAHDNEYVIGMLENKAVPQEGAHFWKNNWPGDDYCEWQIPPRTPVAIPRHVANHLHENLKYHTFKYKEQEANNQVVDQFKEKFDYSQTHDRMTFQPLQAFG